METVWLVNDRPRALYLRKIGENLAQSYMTRNIMEFPIHPV